MDRIAAASVVLLSGGQDSTTCLAWARRRFDRVYSVAFDYGQRHRVELEAAEAVAVRAGVNRHRVVPVSSLADLGGNALVGDGPDDAVETLDADTGLPATFVPGRNLFFLTLAAAWAYQLEVAHLVTGVCETDFSGYPDCRHATMESLQETLCLGLAREVVIHTPLMELDKAATVRLAAELDALDLLAWSHTCDRGAVPPCGRCPACRLRAKGFARVGIPDPLIERLEGRG